MGGSGEEGGRILLHGEDANTCQIPLVKGGGGPPPLVQPTGGGGVKRGGRALGFLAATDGEDPTAVWRSPCATTHTEPGCWGGFGRRSCRRV